LINKLFTNDLIVEKGSLSPEVFSKLVRDQIGRCTCLVRAPGLAWNLARGISVLLLFIEAIF
jgi:hypothetical protein